MIVNRIERNHIINGIAARKEEENDRFEGTGCAEI